MEKIYARQRGGEKNGQKLPAGLKGEKNKGGGDLTGGSDQVLKQNHFTSRVIS